MLSNIGYICPIMSGAPTYGEYGCCIHYDYCCRECVAYEEKLIDGKYRAWRCTTLNSPWRDFDDGET